MGTEMQSWAGEHCIFMPKMMKLGTEGVNDLPNIIIWPMSNRAKATFYIS